MGKVLKKEIPHAMPCARESCEPVAHVDARANRFAIRNEAA